MHNAKPRAAETKIIGPRGSSDTVGILCTLQGSGIGWMVLLSHFAMLFRFSVIRKSRQNEETRTLLEQCLAGQTARNSIDKRENEEEVAAPTLERDRDNEGTGRSSGAISLR